jgi:transposase
MVNWLTPGRLRTRRFDRGAVPMMDRDDGPSYGGIDTHADTHHVAVIDGHGRPLGDVRVPATAVGNRQAAGFIGRWADVAKVGVE